MCNVKRLTLAAFGLALLGLMLATPPAHAQRPFVAPQIVPGGRGIPGTGGTLNPFNYYDPYGASRQAAFNIALYGRAMSQVPPYALGYNPYPQLVNQPYYPAYGGGYGGGTLMNNSLYTGSPGYAASPGYGAGSTGGYSDYPPSSYAYVQDPTNAFLTGAATVMAADGKFRIANQQANQIREQVKSAHIDNQRKAFDEYLYERANRPTWMDDVERQRKINLRYALTSPSGSEVLDGISLNTLLDSLKDMQTKGKPGEDVELSPDLLKQINVTAGAGANPGLLKTEKLVWPLGLSGTKFADTRTSIERNLAHAIGDAERDQRDEGRLTNLQDTIKKMSDDLDAQEQFNHTTPSQYIEAKKYLKLLDDAVKALSGANAKDYVNNKYAAKGKTVRDLVKNMAGLHFAPAAPGDEQAYKALQEKLAEYYKRSQPSMQ